MNKLGGCGRYCCRRASFTSVVRIVNLVYILYVFGFTLYKAPVLIQTYICIYIYIQHLYIFSHSRLALIHTHTPGHEYTLFQDDPDTLYHFDPHLLTSSPSHLLTSSSSHPPTSSPSHPHTEEEEGEDVSVEDCLATIAQFVPDQLVQSLTKR